MGLSLSYKLERKWNCAAELMMLQFGESGHPVLRGTSPLSRGTSKSSGGGKSSKHYNVEPQTAELQLRRFIAVSQLSIYGAVTKWCNSKSPLQTAEPQVEEHRVLAVPPQLVTRITMHRAQDNLARGDLVRERDERPKII